MTGTPPGSAGRLRRALLFLAIVGAQFGLFETGMRRWGGSEASPAFQQLFMNDPVLGYRLRPGARVRFRTPEFTATITVSEDGVRAEEPLGPKMPGERRIVILGDSLVLSVQVDYPQTFVALLEERLNRAAPAGTRYRVINAGVQGYGPVEKLLFFRRVARALEPDVVLFGVFVGNDAEQALASQPKLLREAQPDAEPLWDRVRVRARRTVRRSMVLSILRQRALDVLERFQPKAMAAEPPLQVYLSLIHI